MMRRSLAARAIGLVSIFVCASSSHVSGPARYPDPRVKVNLVAPSMGGLDCRDMISSLGMADKVASLTTVGTPHHGSPVADITFGLMPGPVFDMLNLLIHGLGWDLTGGKEL